MSVADLLANSALACDALDVAMVFTRHRHFRH
jgi:AICAR transformylase/IMP cyclohydrolase PurH